MQHEFHAIQGVAQACLQPQALAGGGGQRLGVEAIGVAAVLLRLVHGQIGMLDQLGHSVRVLREQADADADADELLDIPRGRVDEISAKRIRPGETVSPLKELCVARGVANEETGEPLLVLHAVRDVKRIPDGLHERLTCTGGFLEFQPVLVRRIAAAFSDGRVVRVEEVSRPGLINHRENVLNDGAEDIA